MNLYVTRRTYGEELLGVLFGYVIYTNVILIPFLVEIRLSFMLKNIESTSNVFVNVL
jgi:hypothetical protein